MEKFKTQTSFSETKFLCFLTNCASPTPTPNASTHTHSNSNSEKETTPTCSFFGEEEEEENYGKKKILYKSTDRFPSFFPHLELPRRKRLE